MPNSFTKRSKVNDLPDACICAQCGSTNLIEWESAQEFPQGGYLTHQRCSCGSLIFNAFGSELFVDFIQSLMPPENKRAA